MIYKLLYINNELINDYFNSKNNNSQIKLKKSMFGKTIRNIQTTRIPSNNNNYQPSQHVNNINGYNTQRYQRFTQPISQQHKYSQPKYPQQLKFQQQPKYLEQPKYSQKYSDIKNQQKRNGSSGQFSQLKKIQNNNKTSELVIRQCDPTQLNHYKKPTIRPSQENIYQYQQPISQPSNSSSKKQRFGISQRGKGYDSNLKQPLEQIHYSDRDNKPISSDRYSTNTMDSYYDMQQQFESLKQCIFQLYNQQANQMKKYKTSLNSIQIQCMGELQNVANQISRQLNKQKQDMIGINKRGIDTQRDLRYLKDSFNSFVKDNEEKMQSLVLEMNGGNNKKSKNTQQFGVDLKSSSHLISGGVGTSMSVNFQNQNINLKLYNQTSAQLQLLKGQLQLCKQKIQLLQKDTKILQLQKKSTQQQNKQSIKQKIDLKQVQKLIIEKFSQQRKKYSFTQKIQQLDLKNRDLYKVYQDMDLNIKGMNAQFTRVINGTVIKKQKMLQAKVIAIQQKLVELTDKTSTQQIQQIIKTELKPQFSSFIQQKSSSIKVIKIRQQTAQQKIKLQNIKNPQITYLLDEDGYLLDSSGNYIVESNQNGNRQKIKVQKNLIYLLQSQGIQVKSI